MQHLHPSNRSRFAPTLRASVAVLAAALSLAACGGASSGVDSDTGEGAMAPGADGRPALTGRWVSACTPAPQADGSVQHFALDFDLTDDRWTLDYTVFGDDACETELVTVNIHGAYELGAPSNAVDGAWEARFGFDDKTITPHVDGLAQMLNGLEACGGGEFTVGTPQSVYDVGCPGFGQYPREMCGADYDLVHLDGDTLRFGERPADNNMCEPDRRPQALSPVTLSRG